MTNPTPRIYVACLAAYNNGILHGAWIDADQEAWATYDDVRDMLAASPIAGAEEWAIHDYEGFGGVRLEECSSFERVSQLATFIADHGEIGAALLDYYSGDLEEAREAIADRYHGAHASLADYVQELTEGTTSIPTTLRFYIDWQALQRKVSCSIPMSRSRTPGRRPASIAAACSSWGRRRPAISTMSPIPSSAAALRAKAR